MDPPSPCAARRAGFSLMEIVAGLALVALLAASLAMEGRGLVDRGKTSRVVALVETLEESCAAYRADVGAFAQELSNTAVATRCLSGEPATPGWRGPYLERPLSRRDNPFGGTLHLYAEARAAGRIPGIDLEGDGVVDVAGPANLLLLTQVDPASARTIDDALDGGLLGRWERSGRVRYERDRRQLFILVLR